MTYTPRPWEALREHQLSDLLNAYTTTLSPGPWAAPRPSRMPSKASPTIDDAFNPDAAYPLAEKESRHG
ncbi:hypothetical protein [Streptomyces sp. WZ-12]|uniref:hypothetical protein n=1 Tax=Streptomyces sp. WZ-12 TaxID=3030210 RepID=UPI0023816998|nr:hypothetical protein [Streptomyces sp. WZ-12]